MCPKSSWINIHHCKYLPFKVKLCIQYLSTTLGMALQPAKVVTLNQGKSLSEDHTVNAKTIRLHFLTSLLCLRFIYSVCIVYVRTSIQMEHCLHIYHKIMALKQWTKYLKVLAYNSTILMIKNKIEKNIIYYKIRYNISKFCILRRSYSQRSILMRKTENKKKIT